jgi:hypothetical protein
MSSSHGKTWAGLAEAFTIFAKYDEGRYMTQAEHDIIYSGPDPAVLSDEDAARLEQLRWEADHDLECFYYFV